MTEQEPVTKCSKVSIADVETTLKAKPAFQEGKSKTSRELDFLIE
jgi:hypothetical protein